MGRDGYHTPVLLDESLAGLKVRSGGTYLDGTAGGGGHSAAICAMLGRGGWLVSVDKDESAVARTKEVRDGLGHPARWDVVKGDFADMRAICGGLGVAGLDGVLLDLGVSSEHLDDGARGFSYGADAPLDMRMDRGGGVTAADVVNGYDEGRLASVIRRYGEEAWAGRIASFICAQRAVRPIATTGELVRVIDMAVPAAVRHRKGVHPARRTFQAIRMEVNGELEALGKGLEAAVDLLLEGGRICVVTFHSLEDRAVKDRFRKGANPCVCPAEAPICVCGIEPSLKVVNARPITASERELAENRRARSAKLRVAERLPRGAITHKGG
ncbi:MAG: 16S rRNA (cytosine(1402)-N(4))-methyltransferase RsmH [Oscillospiraceae bacterium]|nr:16S rRNA (cytosine(1402)-N(4))-methyltransferase RsmH [Oscillospiraceae bacterium]